MKTRYSTDQIYHRWAHQLDAHRITNGSNLRADGACLFSYAECIGIVTDNLTLISSYKWSVTTSKHQWKARQAANHHNIIMLPCRFPRDGSLPHLAQIAREQAATTLRNIDYGNKARTINAKMRAEYAEYCALLDFLHLQDADNAPAPFITTLAELRALRDGQLVQDKAARLNGKAGALKLSIDDARNFIKSVSCHGIDSTLDSLRNMASNCQQLQVHYSIDNITAPDYLSKLPAQAKRLLPKLEAMRDARDAERMRINADKIADWRAGNNPHLPRELPPMLRIEGNQIATSWGASVPVTVAPFIWELVTKARASDCSTSFTLADNVKVGDFRLEEVSTHGNITVGCHVIAYSELELIAHQLDFI